MEEKAQGNFPEPLQQWFEILQTNLPHLTRPQARVLAMWSYSLILTKRIGVTSNANFLSSYLGQDENTLRQRLREWYWEAEQKRGAKRRELDVTAIFPELLQWVLRLWSSQEKRILLAIDATTHKDVFVALTIHVVYRSCAIPIAWRILPANQSESWKPHWQELFECLKGSIPQDWKVIVMADRGLYASWLFQLIQDLGWHPFLRINQDGKFKLPNEDWQDLQTFITESGQQRSEEVFCFKHNTVRATLLARWVEGYEAPWYILTDLDAQEAQAAWYGMRSWIESGYRDLKQDGWQWESTRITNPKRAERVWLVMAVAMLWVLSEGSQSEDALYQKSQSSKSSAKGKTRSNRGFVRAISCFLRGLHVILAKLLKKQTVSLGPLTSFQGPVALSPQSLPL